MELESLFHKQQFSIPQVEKDELLFAGLKELDSYHQAHCASFKKIRNSLSFADQLSEPSFLPVSMFKNHDLLSIPKESVHKLLTSSGTSGQAVSKIYLDADTASLQVKALATIIGSVTGKARLPMLIIDSPDVLKNRDAFSARGAGILGMMNFGRDYHYALNSDLTINEETIKAFCTKYAGQPKLIFGFTFLVWTAFLENKNLVADLSESVLVHSGGWKKLEDKKIDNAAFKKQLDDRYNLKKVYNFYGMVEQVGSVFLEGDDGYLYPPNFADIIIRDPLTFKKLDVGQVGVIQVVSLLPKSYPGHSILTEDLGMIEYVDRGIGGRMGKAFRILGRIPQAELRGCSDVIATSKERAG